MTTPRLTLPTDSKARKDIPLATGCDEYFPAALAGVARHSFIAGARHTLGEPMHHKRGASMDHRDCIRRHMADIADMVAAFERAQSEAKHAPYVELIEAGYPEYMEALTAAIITEANATAWRALAYVQELHERFAGAPLAPAARKECGARSPAGDTVCARGHGHTGLHMGASMIEAQRKLNEETPPGETPEQRAARVAEYEAHRGRGPLVENACAACGRETPQAVDACDRWDCPKSTRLKAPPAHTCAIGSKAACAACELEQRQIEDSMRGDEPDDAEEIAGQQLTTGGGREFDPAD